MIVPIKICNKAKIIYNENLDKQRTKFREIHYLEV